MTLALALAVNAVATVAVGQGAVGLAAPVVDLVLLGALIPLRCCGGLSAGDLGLRRVPAARAVGLVVLAVIAVVYLDDIFGHLFGPLRSGSPFAGIDRLGTLAVVVGGLAATVTAPAVEEIFFRGLIYRCLRNRLSTLPAATVGAVLFAGVHAPLYPAAALPGVACFGFIACLLYERTGSLLPGIALHSIVDANAFEVTLTGQGTVVVFAYVAVGLGLLAWAAFASLTHRLTGRAAGG